MNYQTDYSTKRSGYLYSTCVWGRGETKNEIEMILWTKIQLIFCEEWKIIPFCECRNKKNFFMLSEKKSLAFFYFSLVQIFYLHTHIHIHTHTHTHTYTHTHTHTHRVQVATSLRWIISLIIHYLPSLSLSTLFSLSIIFGIQNHTRGEANKRK